MTDIELAKMLDMPLETVKKALERLEEKGLIKSDKKNPFMCHFKPMDYDLGDKGNGGTEELT